MNAETSIRLGKKRVPPLAVPGEIFEVYQPHIGPNATLLWLNLRWLVHVDASGDIEQILQQRTGFSFSDLTEALSMLVEYGLLEIADTGEYVVNEPLTAADFTVTHCQSNAEIAASDMENGLGTVTTAVHDSVTRGVAAVGTEAVDINPTDGDKSSDMANTVSIPVVDQPAFESIPAASAVAVPKAVDHTAASPLSRRNRRRLHAVKNAAAETAPSATPPAGTAGRSEAKSRRGETENRSADMDAVVQIYHKRVGMLGPTQFEKLQFWVEEQGMAGEVVALAIEEMVRSAENPRIQYLEGILRNWFNDGIFTLQDLLKHKKASKVLARDDVPAIPSMEGVPNAAAYRRVDPEMVKKWKELYPDEYDS